MDFIIKGVLKKDEIESQEIYYVINKKEVFKIESEKKLEIEIPKIVAKKGLIKDNTPIEISISIELEKELLKEKQKAKEEKPMLLIPIKEDKKEELDKILKDKLVSLKANETNEINKENAFEIKNKIESKSREEISVEKVNEDKNSKNSFENEEDLEKSVNEFLEKIKKLKEKIKEELQHI